MTSIFPGSRFVIVILSAGLLSCSGVDSDRQKDAAPTQVYGAEDKRIAQSLSVGSRSLIDSVQSPYDRALLCKVSVDGLALKVRAALNAEQSALIDSARRAFEQRLRVAASEFEKSGSEIAADIAKLEEGADPSAQARVSLACLRDLT